MNLKLSENMQAAVLRLAHHFCGPHPLPFQLITNKRKILGNQVNGRGVKVIGRFTIVAVFATSIGFIVSLFMYYDTCTSFIAQKRNHILIGITMYL